MIPHRSVPLRPSYFLSHCDSAPLPTAPDSIATGGAVPVTRPAAACRSAFACGELLAQPPASRYASLSNAQVPPAVARCCRPPAPPSSAQGCIRCGNKSG